MNESWLWNREGEPDPEVERLERLLSEYRYRGHKSPRVRPWKVAAAALVVVSLGIGAWLSLRGPTGQSSRPELRYVARVTAGESFLKGPADQEEPVPLASEVVLAVGDRIRTGRGGEASIESPDIGRVTLFADSVLALRRLDGEGHHFALERGRLHANILPPPLVKPRLFQVATPRGQAIDLGCAYDLEVNESGTTHIRVTLGAVAFAVGETEIWVPRGHDLSIGVGVTQALPFARDTWPEFREAAESYFSGQTKSPEDDLERALRVARQADAMTLWHLAQWVDEETRPRVLDRLLDLVPIRAEFELQALLDLKPEPWAHLRRTLSGF